MKKDTVALLLCAGKGTRMNDNSTNKVCFEVNGTPAVCRTIDNMKKAGIDKFVCVVGTLAEKVMECLSQYDGMMYAFQSEQNGTGNAALMGLRALKKLGYSGNVLISMGDKIISPEVFENLIEKSEQTNSKCVFAVQKKEYNPTGGRILQKYGNTCGIYEMTDSYALLLGSLKNKSREAFESALSEYSLNPKKQNKIVDYAMSNINNLPDTVNVGGCDFDFGAIESGKFVNTATYLCDLDAVYDAVNALRCDNAQGEVYLTDAINTIAADFGCDIIEVEKKEDMLSFGTKEELAEINDYFVSIERNCL